jgi:hypothetical protein
MLKLFILTSLIIFTLQADFSCPGTLSGSNGLNLIDNLKLNLENSPSTVKSVSKMTYSNTLKRSSLLVQTHCFIQCGEKVIMVNIKPETHLSKCLKNKKDVQDKSFCSCSDIKDENVYVSYKNIHGTISSKNLNEKVCSYVK